MRARRQQAPPPAMSPLARSLLALAAAALLHGACADSCTTVQRGEDGVSEVVVLALDLDQTDSVIDLPFDSQCARTEPMEVKVGMSVAACDPFGAAPRVQLLDDDRRARIECVWTDGQQCPQGINVIVTQKCDYDIS